MSRTLAHRLRRIEQRRVLRMARRLAELPHQVCLAAYLDCAPEQLPPPESFWDGMSPEEEQRWDDFIARVPVLSPQEYTQALATSLLTGTMALL